MAGSRQAPGGQVAVWHLDLDAAAPALAEIEALIPRLSPDECTRAGKIISPDDARRWLAAHVALRLVLEREGGPEVRRQPYAIGPAGKPALAGIVGHFSLSHTAGHALIATSRQGPVGVDVEQGRTVRMAQARRDSIVAAAEQIGTQPLPRDAAARFLQAWVRMEAVAKAEGTGLATILSRAGAFGPNFRNASARGGGFVSPALVVIDLALGDDLFGAVAMPVASTGVHVGTLPPDRQALQAFALGR